MQLQAKYIFSCLSSSKEFTFMHFDNGMVARSGFICVHLAELENIHVYARKSTNMNEFLEFMHFGAL